MLFRSNSETDLIRQENELKTDIHVTKIPEGQDPDEVVLRDAREWEEILARARPIVTFRMETAAAGKNLSDAKVKQEIADEVLPLIEEVANPVERETYRQQLAEFLNVDVRFLISAPRPKKTKSSSAQVAHDPGTGDSSSGFGWLAGSPRRCAWATCSTSAGSSASAASPWARPGPTTDRKSVV